MSKAWSKDMVLDAGTFGGSPACHALVDMMNKNVISIRDKHKVLSFMNRVNYTFKRLSSLAVLETDKSGHDAKTYLKRLALQDLLNQIDTMNYPDLFKNVMKNIVHYMCRKNLELWRK